jgi:RimJ/RimL family protein N-acetyltransferase
VKLLVPAQPLTDGVVALRGFTSADVADLVDIVADPVIRSRNAVPVATPEAVRAWLSRVEDHRLTGRRLVLALCDAPTGALAGARSLTVHAQRGAGEVSCWVAPQWRGRSFGPRSARLLAQWAFALLPFDHLALYCDADNFAAQRGAEKAGFTPTGPLEGWHAGDDMLAYRLAAPSDRHDAVAA